MLFMNPYQLMATITTGAVLLAYLNARFIRLPMAIAMMASALLLSLIVLLLGPNHIWTKLLLDATANINFNHLLLNGFLGPLLFAGALTVDLEHLKQRKWEVGVLAGVGTLVSTLLIAGATFGLLQLFGISLPWLFCLLFGALISPTDPIAVLSMFKDLRAPRAMSAVLEGESLFNDGVGIVIFTTLYAVAFTHQHWHASSVILLFIEQALGGLLFGGLIGWLSARLLKPQLPLALAFLLTLATVLGGYALAQAIHLSGALAMVVAGMMIGQYLRSDPRLAKMKEAILLNWEIIDEFLNALLFLLMGLELLLIPFKPVQLTLGLLLIAIILAIRWISVALPLSLLAKKQTTQPIPYEIAMLTWGGLRGGLAIALALSMPPSAPRDTILALTYCVVTFAILVQGLSMRKLIALSFAKQAIVRGQRKPEHEG